MKAALCFLLVFSVFSCKVEHQKMRDQKTIVCTTSIIADCIQTCVDSSFHVVSLMGPGVDPHAYNPRPSDIFALNNASVIVYNGFHLEGKMAELFERLSTRKKVVAISTYFPSNLKIKTDQISAIDPHIWFDPKAWLDGVEGALKQIGTVYPSNRKAFFIRFEKYKTKVLLEYERLKLEINSIPKSQRVLITSHDAFHYFGRAFGIQVRALQGISTTQEPGVKDVIDLVDFIVQNNIKALFVEHSVSPKAIQTVIESCERKNHHVVIGGTLYSDALGEKQQLGGSYLGMLQHNTRTIIRGLK